MSYTPTTWAAGDTITSAKLNKLEQGLGNAITFVHMSEVEMPEDDNDNPEEGQLVKSSVDPPTPTPNLSVPIYKLDKNYEELSAAFESGLVLCIREEAYDDNVYKDLLILNGLASSDSSYAAYFSGYDGLSLEFTANSSTSELIQLLGSGVLPSPSNELDNGNTPNLN